MTEIWWRAVPAGTLPCEILETFRALSFARYGVDLAVHATPTSRHLDGMRAERRAVADWQAWWVNRYLGRLHWEIVRSYA